MSANLASLPSSPSPETLERVLLGGDLSKLSPAERLGYYRNVCESLGLNPLTKPLEYITLSGKLTLYARKDATEQLRRIHGVSITELTSDRLGDVFVVTAKAQDKSGRTDAATGAVAIGSLKGEALANALMKAETKSKRRVTLSICGLGLLDETEVETIPEAVPQDTDLATGEIRTTSLADKLTTPISDAQRKRLFAIARKAGWTSDQVRAWLRVEYGLETTSALKTEDYDAVCRHLEAGPPVETLDPDQPF